MKKQGNHSKWKEWEKSPERTNNSLQSPRSQVQKGGNKDIELERLSVRNTDYCSKETETIERSQLILKNSFVGTEAKLKAINSRLNNAEEWIHNLEGRIREITQSEEQMERHILNNESNI